MDDPLPPSTPVFGPAVKAMWRGLCLRCPHCAGGALFAGYMRLNESCSDCGYTFEFHPGNWSGAVMISQMLMGLIAIPVWIVLTLTTTLEFTYSVTWTVVIVVALWFASYRNIKGMWYGWLCFADQAGHAPSTPR